VTRKKLGAREGAIAAMTSFDFETLVRIAVCILATIGISLCIWLVMTSREGLRSTRVVRLGHIDFPSVTLYKLVGLFGMFLIPLTTVGLANYEIFVGTKEVSACVRCHVMRPFANDMTEAKSEGLAARHYRNKWIQEQQCYHCHADYGFGGGLQAKLDGLRHLLKYTSRTYHEPIQLRHPFHNDNCLHCHGSTPKYDAVDMHTMMADTIASDETPCTSCHGDSHPSRDKRTPGAPE